MNCRSIYLITYIRDGKEFVEEVPAYSEEQAIYLASCAVTEIVDIEVAVSAYHRYV